MFCIATTQCDLLTYIKWHVLSKCIQNAIFLLDLTAKQKSFRDLEPNKRGHISYIIYLFSTKDYTVSIKLQQQVFVQSCIRHGGCVACFRHFNHLANQVFVNICPTRPGIP